MDSVEHWWMDGFGRHRVRVKLPFRDDQKAMSLGWDRIEKEIKERNQNDNLYGVEIFHVEVREDHVLYEIMEEDR